MNITVINSEEYKGLVTLFLSNGEQISFPTEKLYSYVEDNALNTESHGNGLTCDPTSSEYDVTIDLDTYIDNNWDQVCSDYYKFVILKIA